MQAQRLCDLARFKKLTRFLINHPRVVQEFRENDDPKEQCVHAVVDADNGGDIKTRRSTVGQAIKLYGNVVKHACNLLTTTGLSSAENEYYAISAGATSGLGVQAMMADWGIEAAVKVAVKVSSDSSAARAFASRRGLGRLKHIQTRYLWVQERVAQKALTLATVASKENVADLLTKMLSWADVRRHMKSMRMLYADGRAGKAKQLIGAERG